MSFRNFVRTKTLWNTSERLLLYTLYTCQVLIELIQRKLDFFCSNEYKVSRIGFTSSHRRCSIKKVAFPVISKNSQENSCARVTFLIKLKASACNFIKKETLAQVLSCEFFKISKNTFQNFYKNVFYRTPSSNCF